MAAATTARPPSVPNTAAAALTSLRASAAAASGRGEGAAEEPGARVGEGVREGVTSVGSGYMAPVTTPKKYSWLSVNVPLCMMNAMEPPLLAAM